MNFGKLLAICLLLVFICIDSLYAAPSANSVARLERNVSRAQKRLNRKFNRLNALKQAQVVNRRSGKSDDSDADGVPDNLETSSGRCDSDSDDDGVLDGDEYDNGTDPNDSDSDDDGYSDADEFEVHATITAKGADSVTAGGVVYKTNASTEFYDDNDNAVTFDFFSVGDCVELEGHNDGADKILEKIESDDDC